MLCVPAVSEAVEHFAVRTLPLPASATAKQPAMELAPSLNVTGPVGEVAVTVAVNVTFVPSVEGVSDVANVVVLGIPFTTCERPLLVEPALVPSPL